MEKENKISLNISEAEMQAILQTTQTLQDKLLPMLLQLSPGESKELSLMGDKTVAFVNKAYEYAVQNPELCPKFMDVSEMRKDMDAVEALRRITKPLEQLVKFLNDTQMVAGSEAFGEALVFYNAVKGATKMKIGASQQIYEDLKQRFPGRPKTKKTDQKPE